MTIEYILQETRGVAANAAPLLLETRDSVDFRFRGLKEGTRYVLSAENNHYEVKNDTVTLAKFRLKKGVLRPELFELDGSGKIIGKYVLTPLAVVSMLEQIPDKLIAYPETDGVFVRLTECEMELERNRETIDELTDICAELTAAEARLSERIQKAEENLAEINKHIEDPLGGR